MTRRWAESFWKVRSRRLSGSTRHPERGVSNQGAIRSFGQEEGFQALGHGGNRLVCGNTPQHRRAGGNKTRRTSAEAPVTRNQIALHC